MIRRRFEYIAGKSCKFWEVEYPDCPNDGTIWRAWWGRIGTAGQSAEWEQSNWINANGMACDKIAEKLGKGYVEMTDAKQTKDTRIVQAEKKSWVPWRQNAAKVPEPQQAAEPGKRKFKL